MIQNFKPALQELAKLIIREDALFKKSKEDGDLGIHLENIVKTKKGAVAVADEIYKSFSEVNELYKTGSIPLTRFLPVLNEFKEFFGTADIEKSDLPSSLKAEQILIEINKYVC